VLSLKRTSIGGEERRERGDDKLIDMAFAICMREVGELSDAAREVLVVKQTEVSAASVGRRVTIARLLLGAVLSPGVAPGLSLLFAQLRAVLPPSVPSSARI
jgi:hypothetical protein